MNRLKFETSPYLLQHAENPVDWFPWCEEAFTTAKMQDKPVFVSIGYSTCHWCHVMAEESFNDEETAKLLNDVFVCIKVDREERPDVDSVYMEACKITTGAGGWPLSVFLTPEQKPFYIGTYFPKNSTSYTTGLIDLIKNIDYLWKNNRQRLIDGSDGITAALNKSDERNSKSDPTTETYGYLRKSFDGRCGGFGNSPKFPMPSYIDFLIKRFQTNGDTNALKMAEKTLVFMYKGGIFDHIGYGFSRYSTDRFWLVPHFEKTLYDNAQLISTYTECYKATNNEIYGKIARRIIDFLLREMSDCNGAFYSAQDADSEGVEGLYYLFTPEEITHVLGLKDGGIFAENYGVTERGNFAGKNILNQLPQDGVRFDEFNAKLYEYRKKRFPLRVDDKIITVWNCLAISALTKAASVFVEPEYFKSAIKALGFIERNLTGGECVFTSWRDGKHVENGVLDDYAFLIKAYIDVYNYTLDVKYFEKAMSLTETAKSEFYDVNCGFNATKASSKQLIARLKETYDGVIPSGNSVMLENIYTIAAYTGDKKWYALASAQEGFLETHSPYGGASYYAYVKLKIENFRKVVVVSEEPIDVEKHNFCGFDLVKVARPDKEYRLLNNKTTYYVCEGSVCLPPTDKI